MAFAGVNLGLLKDGERKAIWEVFMSSVQREEGKILYKIVESDDLYNDLGIESKEAHKAIAEFYLRQIREGSGLPGSKV